jgi:uncharacterized membrane protein
MGVTIRHYFNTMHARQGNPNWTWAATAVIFVIIMWLSTAPMFRDVEVDEARDLTRYEMKYADAAGFSEARDVVLGRCSMCHAREPVWPGINWAPRGVLLETDADIAQHARPIYLQAGLTHAMPPANVTAMTDEDRARIVAWYRAARAGTDVASAD